MRRKLLAALLLAAVCCTLMLPSGLPRADATNASTIQNNIKNLEKELDGLTAQKKDVQKQYKATTAEKNSQIKVKESIDAEIGVLEKEIALTNDLISSLNQQMLYKQLEADELQDDIDAKYELFKKRMRTSYEEGTVSLLSVFLSADNFTDMLTQLDVIENILDYDSRLISSLKTARAEVLDVKAEIETAMGYQIEVKAGLTQLESELEEKLKESNKLINELSSDADKYKDQLDEIEKAEDKLEAEIKKQLLELSKLNTVYVGGDFIWPLPAQYTNITSPYGMRYHPVLKKNKLHTGTDISAPKGTEIYAMNGGTVVTATFSSGYGNYVIIDHGGGKATLYAHMMSPSNRSVGEVVKQGNVVGKVGSTGMSTGNHLHFEIRINGSTVDPMTYFTKQ